MLFVFSHVYMNRYRYYIFHQWTSAADFYFGKTFTHFF